MALSRNNSNELSNGNFGNDGAAFMQSLINSNTFLKPLKHKLRYGGRRSPAKAHPDVTIDENDKNLKSFYWSISHKTKFDQSKLQHECK